MLLEILVSIIAGVLFGIITGLTPGVHVNLISVLLLASAPVLAQHFSFLALAVFIIAMALTHTFLDSIPSIFLGAPESDTALGVLPGHRYLLKGHGYAAVKLTLIGSLGAIILSTLIFPLLVPFVKHGYPLIEDYMGWFLVGVACFMIIRDKNKAWALIVFLLSGALGVIVLGMPNLKNPLFPLLTGLFGISTLIISLMRKESIPKQVLIKKTPLDKKKTIKALVSGQASGFLTAVFPGLGAATAAVISLQFTRKLGDHGFLILIGAINTVNFTLSLLTLLVLGKARNGAVITVQKLVENITLPHILLFLSTALIAGGAAFILGLYISRGFSSLIMKINYKALVTGIICFLVILTIILSRPIGLLILLTSTAIGLIPPEKKLPRVHAMGCLLVPVIGYFLI